MGGGAGLCENMAFSAQFQVKLPTEAELGNYMVWISNRSVDLWSSLSRIRPVTHSMTNDSHSTGYTAYTNFSEFKGFTRSTWSKFSTRTRGSLGSPGSIESMP